MNIIEINIGQSPGYPAMIKGSITAADGSDLASFNEEVWSFDVMKYGNIGGVDCANTGPEFNPLAEFIYGQPNPYADPSRGTINDVTIAADSISVTSQDFTQDKFMQNLGGKNSIIGKAIKVSTTRENSSTMMDETVVIGCCVIGQADAPAAPAPAAPVTPPATPTYPTHGHYPGYGQYNGGYRRPAYGANRYGGYHGGYHGGYTPSYGRGW